MFKRLMSVAIYLMLFTSITFAQSITNPYDSGDTNIIYDPEKDAVVLTGYIKSSQRRDLVRLHEEHGFDTIILRSKGGYFNPGLMIATEVRRLGLTTKVEAFTTCDSACAFIWMSGDRKIIEENGFVGFHPPSSVSEHEQDFISTADLAYWIGVLGYKANMARDIINTSPLNMLYLTPEIAERWNLDYEFIKEETITTESQKRPRLVSE